MVPRVFALECPDRLEARYLTQAQQTASSDLKNCYISISNRNNYLTLFYRDYLISSQGSLMAFLSFGEGPDNQTTGAKEFFFFPRNQKTQKFYWSDELPQLIVETSVNFDIIFDIKSSEIQSISNAKIQIDPKISKDNDGGITMQPTTGIIYELPFQMGKAPSTVMSLNGKFKDSLGHICSVKVSDVFKKINQDGDVVVKYSDIQLSRFLKTKCPQLIVNF